MNIPAAPRWNTGDPGADAALGQAWKRAIAAALVARDDAAREAALVELALTWDNVTDGAGPPDAVTAAFIGLADAVGLDGQSLAWRWHHDLLQQPVLRVHALRDAVGDAADALLDAIWNAVTTHAPLDLRGLGTFSVRTRPAYADVPARAIAVFRADAGLRAALAGQPAPPTSGPHAVATAAIRDALAGGSAVDLGRVGLITLSRRSALPPGGPANLPLGPARRIAVFRARPELVDAMN